MIKNLAPDITRKRLLFEGFYYIDIDKVRIEHFFKFITKELGVRTYSDPVIFETGDKGKKENQGYDAFVPLVDSGISCYVWVNRRFISIIIYTCKDFEEDKAVKAIQSFFMMDEHGTEWCIF